MRSAFLGVEPIPAHALLLLQEAAVALRRIYWTPEDEPHEVDIDLLRRIEAVIDPIVYVRSKKCTETVGIDALEDGALYGYRPGLFRRLWNAMRGGR